jgi:folate-dependent phosphoribosylglycinamide formyltransferase PurN
MWKGRHSPTRNFKVEEMAAESTKSKTNSDSSSQTNSEVDFPRIGIITTDSFFSYLLISDLISRHPHAVATVVLMEPRIPGKSLVASVAEIALRTGFSNIFYKAIIRCRFKSALYLSRIGIVKHCVSPRRIAEKFGIEVFESNDCNDEKTLKYLRAKDIDILLSINVYQRMLEPLLGIPKTTAVNTHFGLLPFYKGVSPYIWAMANNEKEIGLTVHHMVHQFDEGRIIKQQKLPLKRGDSAMGVYHQGCLVARKMITDAVIALKENPAAGFDQVGAGSYFSMPTPECISRLKKNGFSLWNVRDFLFVFRSKHNGEMLP